MVAGLATITPASGFVTIPSAVCIGLAGGVACYFAVTRLKAACGYDDSLDVFGVHCVGSVVGMLMLGFLASADANPAIATTYKKAGQVVSLAGGTGQFVNQLIAVAFTVALSAAVTFCLLKVINLLVGLRVDPDAEHSGLDVTEHGEAAYNE
jgi:Amt family ammonium transporter